MLGMGNNTIISYGQLFLLHFMTLKLNHEYQILHNQICCNKFSSNNTIIIFQQQENN